MCGIAGVFGASDPATAEVMLRPLPYHGPDDEFLVSGRRSTSGARRLTIQNVEGGRQPLSNETGTGCGWPRTASSKISPSSDPPSGPRAIASTPVCTLRSPRISRASSACSPSRWLMSYVGGLTQGTLHPERVRRAGLVKPGGVATLLTRFQGSETAFANRVLSLLALHVWSEDFLGEGSVY